MQKEAHGSRGVGRPKTELKDLTEEEFEKLTHQTKKRLVLEDQNNRCNHCGLHKDYEWNGGPVTFEMNHVEGRFFEGSGRRDNLEVLCCVCHFQTANFRGKQNRRDDIDEEAIARTYLKGDKSMSEVIRQYGGCDTNPSLRKRVWNIIQALSSDE